MRTPCQAHVAWGGALLRGKPSEQRPVGWADLSLTAAIQLTPLSDRARRGRFIGLSLGEFKLMVRGRGWLWYSGVIGLTIACLASPPEVVERVLIPAVWLWPILIWAEMGSRESRHNTE